MPEHILAHNHNGGSGRPQIFLRTGVNQSEWLRIERPAQKVGRHITHQRNRCFWKLVQLGTKNSIVAGDVKIPRICRHLVLFGYECVILLFGRGNHIYFPEGFGLLDGLVRPGSCIEIGCCLIFIQKIEGNLIELRACTASQPKYMITIGQSDDFLHQGIGLLNDSRELRAAVRQLQQAEPDTVVIGNRTCRFFYDRCRQYGRTRREIMLFHVSK